MTAMDSQHPLRDDRVHDDVIDEPHAEALAAAEPAREPAAVISKGRRRSLLLVLAVVVVVLGAGYFLFQTFIASRTVSTDDAYVAAESAQVTPLTGGQVVDLAVTDTQEVRKGQVLFRLSDPDQRNTLAGAEADYAAARRRYEQTLAQGAALGATADARGAAVGSARAQVASADADVARTRADLARRQSLVGSGAVSGEELTTARNAFADATARAAAARAAFAQAGADVTSARQNAAAAQALVRGTSIDTAPDVRAAAARLEQARLDLDRTTVRSPVDGVVAKLAIQEGQRVNAGTVTMMIVPVDRLYVDANFKENQLGKVRIGQPVTLTSDLYGGKVVYHGKVAGFAGGTGAAFAAIPAQNATGNWIKVVQRLPLRVTLDPRELRAHPLRVGLSMSAEIDLADSRAQGAR